MKANALADLVTYIFEIQKSRRCFDLQTYQTYTRVIVTTLFFFCKCTIYPLDMADAEDAKLKAQRKDILLSFEKDIGAYKYIIYKYVR